MIIYMLAYILLAICAAVTGLFCIKLVRAFNKFQMKKLISVPIMLEQLPSVSICVPARNEKHAMTQCLERILASTYPKIEIIVHDDESADETSVLIKSFAHEGVRFVEGKPLPEGWLGKNNALNSLLAEASGTYVLFMDVDTLVEPDTIGQLVSYAEGEAAAMVSVLPARNDGYRASVIFGTLRYFWELVKHTKNQPAASSSAWMINRRRFMADFTDFEKYKNRIQPESDIAKAYAASDEYRFLISTKLLGLSYEKHWRSQIDTSIRLYYPLYGYSLPRAVLSVLFLILLNVPLITLIAGLILLDINMIAISIGVHLFAIVFFAVYLYHVRSRGWLLGSLVWPYLVAQELVVFVMSIASYAAGSVTWKGRPIKVSLTDVNGKRNAKSRAVI